MDELVTTLGLSGPRFAPFFQAIQFEAGARPDDGQFTELGLSGARPPQTFLPKDTGGTASRPDGDFTELGLSGPRPPQIFDPKFAGQGIQAINRVTISVSATLRYGRSARIVPDISVSVRPAATLTFAHRNSFSGRSQVSVQGSATLRYTRAGAHRQFSGGTPVTVVPFGFVRVRRRKGMQGSISLAVTPAAVLRYTVAPIRNYTFQASARLRVTPSAVVAYQAGGTDYGVAGSNEVSVTPQGRISVIRQTTYAIHGSVQISLQVNGTIIKTQGAPQAFSIQGSVRTTVTPNGSMGVQTGIINQYFLSGSTRVTVTPVGSMQPSPAVPLDSDAPALETQPRMRRRLSRVFR